MARIARVVAVGLPHHVSPLLEIADYWQSFLSKDITDKEVMRYANMSETAGL